MLRLRGLYSVPYKRQQAFCLTSVFRLSEYGVSFDSLNMANLKLITPFYDKFHQCLSIGHAPSQGLVYALDAELVIKLPFQYIIPDDQGHDILFYLDHGLRSVVAMERELAVYDAAANRPHSNIARRLPVESSSCLFLERLQPLEAVWADSDEKMRHRWVRELVDVVSWLEELGFTHGDLAVRNLAIDSTTSLKLFDFGSATTTAHYDYRADVERDHFGLATCIHYILTGVDPLANVNSAQEVRQIQHRLSTGQGTIGAGAESLADVIQAGWSGHAAPTKFSQVKKRVEEVIGAADQDEIQGSEGLEERYQRLKYRCNTWLKRATPNPRWLSADDYCAACRSKGYDVDIDNWR
jgi:serine/threonine protein kinase